MGKPLPKGILKNKNPLAKGKAKQVKPGSSTDKKKNLAKREAYLAKRKTSLAKREQQESGNQRQEECTE